MVPGWVFPPQSLEDNSIGQKICWVESLREKWVKQKIQDSSQDLDTTPVYNLMCVLKEQASTAVSSVQTSELLPRKILAETLALTKPLLLQSSLQKLGA